MVKIAIAGGSGMVGSEVADALVATGRHEIFVLSRFKARDHHRQSGITCKATDYERGPVLVEHLKGVHTVLSFITTELDERNESQINLIDAAIAAGVKRFAPSEWATSNFTRLPWYRGKSDIRQYLREVNRDKKVLEYCLFQPGWFTNYFAHPYNTATHFRSFETHIDFENCRALVLEGGGMDDRITLTTVQDLANIVVKAVEYEREWPLYGGIRGDNMTVRELIQIGESVRGKPFSIEGLRREDLESENALCSWLPVINHPAARDPHRLRSTLTSFMILAIAGGALHTRDEWNQIFPEYEFTSAKEFLQKAWEGKP